ncbi:metallophosphoesterase [Halobacteriaceae archaeon GCM10025711]
MDAEYADRAVYLPAADALVLADLHVGRDAASNVELPLGERADLTDRLRRLLDRFRPATVVVAGDLLHTFDGVPDGVAETVADVESIVADAAGLVVTPGNHDAMLDAVTEADRVAEHRLGDGTVVLHGHEEPTVEADRYVVGHEHPAIVIEGTKRPCYLLGPDAYRGATVLVLPAFSRLARGTVVNGLRGRDVLSPLVADVDAFQPVVLSGDEALTFPALGDLRSLL